MRRPERRELAAYLVEVADALMAPEMSRDQRNYLTGYASAHLASVAGLLKVADGGDLAGALAKDRASFRAYVVGLLNGGRVTG